MPKAEDLIAKLEGLLEKDPGMSGRKLAAELGYSSWFNTWTAIYRKQGHGPDLLAMRNEAWKKKLASLPQTCRKMLRKNPKTTFAAVAKHYGINVNKLRVLMEEQHGLIWSQIVADFKPEYVGYVERTIKGREGKPGRQPLDMQHGGTIVIPLELTRPMRTYRHTRIEYREGAAA